MEQRQVIAVAAFQFEPLLLCLIALVKRRVEGRLDRPEGGKWGRGVEAGCRAGRRFSPHLRASSRYPHAQACGNGQRLVDAGKHGTKEEELADAHVHRQRGEVPAQRRQRLVLVQRAQRIEEAEAGSHGALLRRIQRAAEHLLHRLRAGNLHGGRHLWPYRFHTQR